MRQVLGWLICIVGVLFAGFCGLLGMAVMSSDSLSPSGDWDKDWPGGVAVTAVLVLIGLCLSAFGWLLRARNLKPALRGPLGWTAIAMGVLVGAGNLVGFARMAVQAYSSDVELFHQPSMALVSLIPLFGVTLLPVGLGAALVAAGVSVLRAQPE